MPGPGVGHRHLGAAAGPGPHGDAERRPLGRVGEDVAEQGVHRGRRGPPLGDAHRQRPPAPGRRRERAAPPRRARDQKCTRSPTTAVASQPAPRPSRSGRRASGSPRRRRGSTASTSSSIRSRSPAAGSRRPAAARSGACAAGAPDRRPTPARRPAARRSVRPAGSPPSPTSRTSGGPGRRRPGPQVAGCPAGARCRQLGDRPGERPGQPVGHEQRQEQQDDAEPAEHQPGAGHARPAAARSGRTPRSTAVPSARRTGCTSRVPSAPSTASALAGGVAVGRGRRRRRATCRRSSGRATVRSPRGADEVRRHLLPRRPARRRDQELQLRLGGVQRPRLGDPRDQGRRREQEGQQHDRRGRRHQQGDLAPHGSGSASRTPTPRTVCSSRGSAALSPSLRRSHDRWTSTVLSEPP